MFWDLQINLFCFDAEVTGLSAYTLQELRNMISVEMGAYKTGRGGEKLITRDLGSCVGIAMWDPVTGIGGLLHIMLPQCDQTSAEEVAAPAKYADTGIDAMIQTLVLQGAKRQRLMAKIAGAAHMYRTEGVPESEDISSRNLRAVRKKLMELNIPVAASEVGAYRARTMVFEPGSGTLTIVMAGEIYKVM